MVRKTQKKEDSQNETEVQLERHKKRKIARIKEKYGQKDTKKGRQLE